MSESLHLIEGIESPRFRVHTSNLLQEILTNTTASILKTPLQIFGRLLADVGERAAQLNDPQLNALMVLLTIYTIADPRSPDYDKDAVHKILAAGNFGRPPDESADSRNT